MSVSVHCSLGFVHSLNVLLLTLVGVSLGSPIRSLESHHWASGGRDVGVNPLLDAQDFLSHFLSTVNLTELRPRPWPREEPPEYMLELYDRYVHERPAVPSASIVRSFRNEDSSPYSVTTKGVRIHPLLFNISMRHHEHITLAELRLFTLVWKAQRPHAGTDCMVTIYRIHEDIVWTGEVGKEEGRRGKGDRGVEVSETEDLEEVVTEHIRARDNGWLSFDLTHVVAQWQKSGRVTHRLEVHVAILGSGEEEGGGAPREDIGMLIDVDIDRGLEGKRNAVMVVFSDDQGRDHGRDNQELEWTAERENDHPGKQQQQEAFRGHANYNHQDEQQDKLARLQSNHLVRDASPPRVRRHVKGEPCKRTPLFVDFKDIGWDTWIIQPLGYEAYECNGVCSPPMTSEVSPTRHAVVQTLLSVKSPERASRACCVPTKLEPISLLYHENGVITFNHKYEGMVVAECGCR